MAIFIVHFLSVFNGPLTAATNVYFLQHCKEGGNTISFVIRIIFVIVTSYYVILFSAVT